MLQRLRQSQYILTRGDPGSAGYPTFKHLNGKMRLRLGGLPGLADRCHVNALRWGNPPTRGWLVSRHTAFGRGVAAFKVIIRRHSTEKLKQKKLVKVKEHQPPKCILQQPFFLFTYFATRDPGVVRLHENAGSFSTPSTRVTPPPCKQALRWEIRFDPFVVVRVWKRSHYCIAIGN